MYTEFFQSLFQNLINTFLPYLEKSVLVSILKNEIERLEEKEEENKTEKYCEGCEYNMSNQQAHYGGCMSFEEL
jgi:hypothetical protein